MDNPYEPNLIQMPDDLESMGERWMRGFGYGVKASLIFIGGLWALVTCGVFIGAFFGASAADTFGDIIDNISEPLFAFSFGSICVSIFLVPTTAVVVGTATAVIGTSKPKERTKTTSQTY